MVARFFCPDVSGSVVRLDDQEAHHAQHVMRLKTGDAVELFDGNGGFVTGLIDQAGRKQVTVQVLERHQEPAGTRRRLIVAAAPPRGDRLKSMVEKLTELGVDELIPLRTVRAVTDPRQSRLDKLRGTVITAMKQCRRNRLLTIHEPSDLSVVLRRAAAAGQQLHLAHPAASGQAPHQDQRQDQLLLVGPEGGFTNEEVLQAVDYGAHRITWPEGILRIETAAVVFSSLLLHRLHVAE